MISSLVFGLLLLMGSVSAGHDYGDALGKSLLFFEAQRSGKLPNTQRANWRADSGLDDGASNGVDLVGGYYDAGDNVKFGLPMAHTIAMLSWTVVEYGKQLAISGQLGHAMESIQWGTDYLLKAHPEPYVLYGQVGDGFTDHDCWQRPEDMTTPRQAYKIDINNPGSDLAGETAAAMAAASMVFKDSNPAYSNELLIHAKQLFEFADKYRGKYDDSIPSAKNFYMSRSGYGDELLWAAAWLYRATGDEQYLNYLTENADSLGGTGWRMKEFSWDTKYTGVQMLASIFLMQGKGNGKDGKGQERAEVLEEYEQGAEFFMCSCVGKNTGYNVQRSPGGLLYWQKWNNLHLVTSASFLLTVYSDYLSSAGNGKKVQCPNQNGQVDPSELVALAKLQADYILGDNPRGTSYMVGYGSNYPRHVHHRASSIVSYKDDSSPVSCKGGYGSWFSNEEGDPNVLVGAIVGGPHENDQFEDARDNYEQTEPTTYNNPPLVGLLARLQHGIISHSNPHPQPQNPKSPKRSPHRPGFPKKESVFAISQKVTDSWNFRGKTYYRYSVSITNSGHQSVINLKVAIERLYGPLWGLSKTGNANIYSFPEWLKSLTAGQSMDFVYIHAAPQATIWIADYQQV